MRQQPQPLDARRTMHRILDGAPRSPKGEDRQCPVYLNQCAQHFRKAPRISPALTTRQEGQSDAVKALSWRMQNRLHSRYIKLKARGKTETKIIVAIARELSAYLWEIQNKLNLPIPGPAIPAINPTDTDTGTKAHGNPTISPLNPPRGTSPLPSPRGSGGESFKKPTPAKSAKI